MRLLNSPDPFAKMMMETTHGELFSKLTSVMNTSIVDGKEIDFKHRIESDRKLTAKVILRIKHFFLVDGGVTTYERLGYPPTWGLWEEHSRIRGIYNDALIIKTHKKK